MSRIYKQSPDNWPAISSRLEYNKSSCILRIIKSRKCLFLDTCSIIQYAHLDIGSPFFTYLDDTYDSVFITRTVIMELISEEGCLKNEHLDFLELIHKKKTLYLMDEEWSYDYLKTVYDKPDRELNDLLRCAIRFAMSAFKNTVSSFLDHDEEKKRYFDGSVKKELYSDFFMNMRSRKNSGDSLGEELTAVLILLLSFVKESSEGKFEFLSNDRKSYYLFSATKKYIKHKCGWDAFQCRTACSLGCLLYRYGYMTENELADFLSVSYQKHSLLKCFAVGSSDLEAVEYTFTLDEYLNKIKSDPLFTIFF